MGKYKNVFDIHVTVHHDKFLKIKPIRCTNFSNLFLEWNSTCFRQFLCPSSLVFHCTHSNGICQQTCMTYTIAVCTVKNSWWWTDGTVRNVEFHSKNRFEKLVHLIGFILRKIQEGVSNWKTEKLFPC